MDNHTDIEKEKDRIAENSYFYKEDIEINNSQYTDKIAVKIHLGNNTYAINDKDIEKMESLGYSFKTFRIGGYVIFLK